MTSKIIVVTGGNRGIGKEICRQLAAKGHVVIMGVRSMEKGNKAAAELSGKVYVKPLDMTNRDQMEDLRSDLEKTFGKLDVLINNAGIISSDKGVLSADIDEIKTIMDTNFFGVHQLTQILSDLLLKSDDPRIINMSSGMGATTDMAGGHAGYRLSKVALNGLTLQWAAEWKGNAKVNAMCPGWVRTDMGGPSASRSVDQGADTAVWLATAEEIPHGKFLRDRQIIPW